MTKSRSWLHRLLLLLLWLAITAGVAFLVARHTEPKADSADLTADIPPAANSDRALVSLSSATIAPTVSLDGVVVADGDTWVLESPVPPSELAYQLIQPPVAIRAGITGGPIGFDCAWLGTGQAPDASVTARCSVPASVPVIAGLNGIMVLQMGDGVQTDRALPLSAVAGSASQGLVVVVAADGSTSQRSVELGAADTFNIEVIAGLQPGEQVLQFPTQRDFSLATAA